MRLGRIYELIRLCGRYKTRNVKWLDEFGLKTSANVVSLELTTDAEEAVSSFISGCGHFTFKVKKAAPRSHESAGRAERTVRAVKESFKTLLMDFHGTSEIMLSSRVATLFHQLCFVMAVPNVWRRCYAGQKTTMHWRYQGMDHLPNLLTQPNVLAQQVGWQMW